MARLGDVCKLVSGNSLPESIVSNVGELPYVKVAELNLPENTPNITTSRSFACPKDICDKQIIPPGTVIFPKRGGAIGTNKKRLVGVPICMDLNLMGVIPASDILPQYLYYFFENIDMGTLSNGSSVPQINNSDIAPLEIRIPSLSMQADIVCRLDKVSELIAMRKEQLAKLDQLVKSRFMELFEDTIHSSNKESLENLSDFVTVGIANSATHAYADSGIVMLRNQNIKENHLDENDLIYITPEFAQKYGSKQLAENDILVIRTGYPGVACMVPKKYEGCQTFTTLIIRLKNATLAHANYVCHYINSSFGKDYVNQSKVGVAQQNFGAKALAKMPIVLPSMELQKQFAAFVEQTKKSKLTIQASLDKLELLKKSLMQQYFG